jgi:HTH-type transcriptional regulator, sugar sensing transcriptional regulator
LGGRPAETRDGVQLLNRLGLTFRQAKVYLALAKYGDCSVREISNGSGVHREDVYRILRELQRKCLVKKRITYPITFEAVPVEDALSFLHERRIRETEELQKKEKKFLEVSTASLASKISSEEDAQFVLIPEKETAVISNKKAIGNAKCSIDAVNSPKRHLLSALVFGKEVNEALGRGVKIRVITQKPKRMQLLPKAEIEIENEAGFKVKYISINPSAFFAIFDNKEVLIVADKTEDIKSSTLWSNNPALLALCSNYFASLWQAC